jgi:arylsulfatase A-like enzyme
MLAFANHAPGSYAAYYDKYSRLGAIQDKDLRNYYLANLACLDDNIGRVLETLEYEGMQENTLIIFLSDNGGSPLTGANNHPLAGGKYALWEGGIRVPMSLTWPGKIEPNKAQDSYVSALDILPTLTKIVGIELSDRTIDGIDLFTPQKDRLLVWKWQKTWAVRKGDWKLTNSNENHWKSRPSDLYIKPIRDDKSIKLFNLREDPSERIDLSAQYPKRVQELSVAYEEWCASNIGAF